MDTESVGYNLSRSQFTLQYLREHHEALNLAEPQVGAVNAQIDEPGRPGYATPTGKRATFSAEEPLVPNQTHVSPEKVDHYIKHPSDRPIFVVNNPETGENHVLDGHHRLVANRIRGVPTKAQFYKIKR